MAVTDSQHAEAIERLSARLAGDRGRVPERGLLIGKGPSFERLDRSVIDLSGYLTLGLNHVVTRTPVDIMNAIDLDVVVDCSDVIAANAGILAVPYHPHVDFKASEKTLFEFFESVPILKTMAEAGRLLVYNASSAKKLPPLQGAPQVGARFFSAEAGYELLRLFGAKRVDTLGVDGGAYYAESFGSFKPLANGRADFGAQFLSMNRTFRDSGVAFGPLGSVAPIRVFIGCDETQYLASRVLEYTLYRHCDTAIQVERIDNRGLPVPSDRKKRARTPFSFARFKIPQLCGFQGRAIYLDADMVVFDNIREIWEQDLAGHALLYSQWGRERRPQYSVMLLDCAALPWRPEEIVGRLERDGVSYDDVMYRFSFMERDLLGPLIAEQWNSLEAYEAGRTKLLHYTDMDRQPWVTNVNEHAELFYRRLASAIADKFITREEFAAELRKGFVSPHLADWIGVKRPARSPDPDTWVPPYKTAAGSKSRDDRGPAALSPRRQLKKLFKRIGKIA